MRRITISLPDSLDAVVRREADRRRKSVSELIRELVTRVLLGTEDEPRELPWAGICEDPGLQGRAVAEELAEGWADAIDRDRG